MKDLLLTLGHNSSAIYVDTESSTIIGYETERLDRIKSSSAFPQLAINQISNHVDLTQVDLVHVSHWFDDFDIITNGTITKHWANPNILEHGHSLCNKVVTLSPRFTHHDAHALSAIAFAYTHADGQPLNDCLIIVADGFGNQEEVFTVYRHNAKTGSTTRVSHVHGYKNSLGLLYQYATAFCGMKENQDEYKFLGYESHVDEIKPLKDPKIKAEFDRIVDAYVKNWHSERRSQDETTRPPMSELDLKVRLRLAKNHIFGFLRNVLIVLYHEDLDNSSRSVRIIVGYAIQQVIEKIYRGVIAYNLGLDHFDTLILCGGLHYNVKLNNICLASLPSNSKICVMPLAGDQGAAIGLLTLKRGIRAVVKSGLLKNLCYGKRDLSFPAEEKLPKDVWHFQDEEAYIDFVARSVADGKIVNTVTGNMEFGPRALCATSTLALPTKENVDTINAINGRNTVMPFAPVMLEDHLPHFFSEFDSSRVIGSLKFMIITLDYLDTVDREKYSGIMHQYPSLDGQLKFSGRPQAVQSDSIIGRILTRLQKIQTMRGLDPHLAIINTSFNTHGVPIVFSVKDAMTDMAFNQDRAAQLRLPDGHVCLAIGNF